MMPKLLKKPTWDHAASRFMCVTPGVIDVLQTHFFNRISFANAIPGITSDKAVVIVAESLEADRIWNLSPDQLLTDFARGPESDFKSAVLAEITFVASDIPHQKNHHEAGRNLRAIAMASLEKIARSPTASPLLWYEDIYFELAQEAQRDAPEEALDWHKCGLAHNLHFNEGSSGVQTLLDLADSYLEKGELERGLEILTALLYQAPDDIWTYNLMAISFERFGLTQQGMQAIERGFQLMDEKGDEEQLRQQFARCRIDMQNSSQSRREADVSPAVMDAFKAALALEFDAGQPRPIFNLCRELVPDLDRIPVKRPLTSAQMPLPDPEKTFELLSQLKPSTPKKRTHRGRRKRKPPVA